MLCYLLHIIQIMNMKKKEDNNHDYYMHSSSSSSSSSSGGINRTELAYLVSVEFL